VLYRQTLFNLVDPSTPCGRSGRQHYLFTIVAFIFPLFTLYLPHKFKQKNRLKKKLEVQRAVKTGKSVFDPVCGIKFLKNNLDESRFAVVVGLKVHKGAVRRNRVKRQYREIVRLHLDSVKPGFDIVLLTSAKALELTYSQKEERLLAVFRKAGLWQD